MVELSVCGMKRHTNKLTIKNNHFKEKVGIQASIITMTLFIMLTQKKKKEHKDDKRCSNRRSRTAKHIKPPGLSGSPKFKIFDS